MNNKLLKFITKILLCTIIVLLIAITCKKNKNLKNIIYNYIFVESINFSKFKNIYNKYLGGIFFIEPTDNKSQEMSIFNNKIKYTNIENYYKGAKLQVDRNYLVPNMYDGIVVYIGKKENYNNVIIIQNNKTGINTWYGNICNTPLKLYDNITNKDYIGESCNDYIYLVYTKNNTFLDYKKYIT